MQNIAWDYPTTESERFVFKPKPKIKVSELAAQIRIVTEGPAQGLWTNEFAPYLVEPMDTFNLPWVRKIYICFAPQMGKTQFALNCLLYCVVVDPGDTFYLMPDEKTMKRIMNRKIIPMVKKTPESQALMGLSSYSANNLKISFVTGMDLMAAWATSPAAMASESARYMFYDEPGKYPSFSGKEADPFSLGDVRTNAYPYTSKQVYFSTPVLDGDPFDTLLKNEPDEVRRYHARCPYCEKLQIMKFRRFHWGKETDHRRIARKNLAKYHCKHCDKPWDNAARDYAVKLGRGRWIAENPVERPLAVAFGPLESWYSPMIPLYKPVVAYLKGKQQPGKMQAFINQHKARAWKMVINTKTEADLLKHKNDIPPGVVPDWAVALTAGIDMQQRGFWFVVRAWDGELNSHLVQYGYLQSFDDVEALVFQTQYGNHGIWRAALDTGGTGTENEDVSRTEEAYRFLVAMKMKYGAQVLHGIKGASRAQFQLVSPPREIDKMPSWKGKRIKGMLELRTLDTFNLKKLLHDRLALSDETVDKNGNPVEIIGQKFYLHSKTGMDYATQFMNEELQEERTGKQVWVEKGPQHLLDCEVYCAACADMSWQPGLQLIAAHLKKSTISEAAPEQPAKTRGIRSAGING